MSSRANSRLAIAALAAGIGLAILWWFSSSAPRESDVDSAPSAAIESVARVEEAAPRLDSPAESVAIAEKAAPTSDASVDRTAIAARPEQLKITVLDSDLAPVLGADISILSEEGRELYSEKIGFDGTCVLHANSLFGGAFVQARAARYFDAVDPLDPFATELRIVLEDADFGAQSTISGYVQRSDGVTAGAGFHVLLRRSWRTQPTVDDVLRVLAGERVDGLQLTQTDDAGKFSFEVRSKVSLFQLHAGGGGWATPSSQAVSDGTFTGLRMRRVYGAKIRLLDDGAPARMPSGDPRKHAKLSLPDPRRRASDLSDAVLVLGGARPDDLVREPHVLHYVFTSEVELPVLGPQSVELKLPGYAPAAIEFDATPIETGFSEVDVPLALTTAGFATLSVIGSGASDVLRAELSKNRPPISKLLLSSEVGEAQEFLCELSFATPVLLEGVPYGTYRASYIGPAGVWIQAPQVLVIDAPTASLNLSLANYGLARVSIRDRDGAPVRGALEVQLHGSIAARADRPPHTLQHALSMRNLPHVLAPLAAGEYTLRHPRFEVGDTAGQARFTVRPGECTEVEIVLGP